MSISTFAKNLRCQEIHDSEYTKKEIVKGVLSYYSSQYSDLLFDSMKDSLLFSDPQELEETSFWANHKEACFVFKAVFSEIQSFFIQNYEPNNAEITAAISSLIQKINSTLLHDLWIITYGINIDLITALSGEVYESKSAKNLRLAIIPEENASFAGTHLIFSFYAPIEFTYTNYRFIIAPDFRNDINVKPLPVYDQKEESLHLAIVNLSESFIYKPAEATLLLAHEVAHYVGDRKRKTRAKLIFKAIGLKLLQNTVFANLIIETKDNDDPHDLIELLSDVLGNFLLNYYVENTEEQSLYYAQSIFSFLKQSQYGLDLFFNAEIRSKLADKIKEALILSLQDRNSSDQLHNQFVDSLRNISRSLQTSYYVNLFIEDQTNAVPYFIFSQKIPLFLSDLATSRRTDEGKLRLNLMYRYIDEIVCSFLEAYADYKMLKLCGVSCKETSIDFLLYQELLFRLSGKNTLQCCFRSEAIGSVLYGRDIAVNQNDDDPSDPIVQKRIIAYIVEYINSFKDVPCSSQIARDAFSVFSKPKHQDQYKHINDTILHYRQIIQMECTTETTKLATSVYSNAIF